MLTLGIDIGGTKTEVALVEFGAFAKCDFSLGHTQGIIKVRKRMPTERHSGYDAFLHRLVQLCHDVAAEAKIDLKNLDGIGFALPGSVNPQTQTMTFGNTLMFVNKDISSDLRNKLSLNCKGVTENDANLFAYAEAKAGAGLNYSHTDAMGIGVILGTGCGGGIIWGGKILNGRRGGGGELGHLELKSGGISCYCGLRGCAEQYISGTGIEASFASRISSSYQKVPAAKEIFTLASELDPIAVAVVKEYKNNLGKFLGTLTTIFDPDYFVLGGGMSLQPSIYEGLDEILERHSFLPKSRTPVHLNKLGDSAGVIGASLIAGGL